MKIVDGVPEYKGAIVSLIRHREKRGLEVIEQFFLFLFFLHYKNKALWLLDAHFSIFGCL